MSRESISYSSVPKSSSLFLDYLYRHDRVSRFYNGPPFDPQTYARVGQDVQGLQSPRKQLVEILLAQNESSGAGAATLTVPGGASIALRITPKVPIARLFFLLGYALNPKGWRDETVDVAEPLAVRAVVEGFSESPRDLLPEVPCRQLDLVLHRRPDPPRLRPGGRRPPPAAAPPPVLPPGVQSVL